MRRKLEEEEDESDSDRSDESVLSDIQEEDFVGETEIKTLTDAEAVVVSTFLAEEGKSFKDLNGLIDKDLISQIKSVLDLGGCYGGYISLLAKDNPNRSYILVDLGENIPLAAYYLSQNHPLMKIKILNNENDKFVPEINSFTLIPAHLFRLIKDEKVDLLCNFVSLAEMSRLHFEEYINSNIYKNSKILHLVNRFVSSPIFSRGSNPHTWLKSTQNLTNYKLENRENKFFDVFPLYHFQPMAEDKNNNPKEYKFTTLASFFWDWKRSPITSQYFHSITVLKK